jgi:2-oxoglutarate ferredoxin oxidoreductase subunit alpha
MTCRRFPFPADIRAPAGTLAGDPSFQLHFADHDILTPGDRPDMLVAMNTVACSGFVSDEMSCEII